MLLFVYGILQQADLECVIFQWQKNFRENTSVKIEKAY